MTPQELTALLVEGQTLLLPYNNLLAVEVSRHPPVCAFQVDADLTPSLSSPNDRAFLLNYARK